MIVGATEAGSSSSSKQESVPAIISPKCVSFSPDVRTFDGISWKTNLVMKLFAAMNEGRLKTSDDFVSVCGGNVNAYVIGQVQELLVRKIERIQDTKIDKETLSIENKETKRRSEEEEKKRKEIIMSARRLGDENDVSGETDYTCLSVMRGKPPILLSREHIPLLKELLRQIECFTNKMFAVSSKDGKKEGDKEGRDDANADEVLVTSPIPQSTEDRDSSTFSPKDSTCQRSAVVGSKRGFDDEKSVTDVVQRRISALRRRLVRDTIHIGVVGPPNTLHSTVRGSHGIKQLPILFWEGGNSPKHTEANLCEVEMTHATYLIAVSCAHVKHECIRSALRSLVSSDQKELGTKVVNDTELPRMHPLSLLMEIAYRPGSLRAHIDELSVLNVKRIMLLAKCMEIGVLEASCRESLKRRNWVLVDEEPAATKAIARG